MEAQIKESKRIVEYELTLKLTHRELVALRTLMDFIGGSSEGPRNIINSISTAIDTISVYPLVDKSLVSPKSPSFYFVDKWPKEYKE